MALLDKLAPIRARYEELAALMTEGSLSGEKYVALSTEYAELADISEIIKAYEKLLCERRDLEVMLRDPEMKEMAAEEMRSLDENIPALEEKIKLALIPKDSEDSKNVILEVRAGTGGDEAALFAADLLSMYRGYATTQGWTFEIVGGSPSDLGGFKEAIAEIHGHNVFEKLKYESGAHRVQRVPKTETSGRVHTSAATVAVLPEAEEVDIDIDAKDLRIDTYRAQGAGGQHINKTDSAVRITHIPTGVVVEMQDERSQHKNRAKAMKILRTRLYDAERQRVDSIRAADRKSQVGTGDRSERIRTYNFPQGRVTDHRINLTLYRLEDIVSGEGLGEVIEQLIAEDHAARLAGMDF
ncbi:MAG: peptide chain release factor 1 [Alphaproteobacteria bacterium CG_4_9_14_3_um_filter_47_13]|nr:MAG: peptide chain release factor 1 [Alphaproteobacteria bacterium CG_4_9_14_3_um_filter_47_13]